MNRLISGSAGALAAAALFAVLPADGAAQERECRCEVAPNVVMGDAFAPLMRLQEMRFPRARIGVALGGEEQEEHEDGAYVQDVTEDGPADRAGIREGDVIVSVDGHRLTEPLDADDERRFDEDANLAVERLMALASEWEPGDEVEIVVERDGQERTFTMEAERSEMGAYSFRMEELGDQMRELAPRIRSQVAPFRGQLRDMDWGEGRRGQVWIGGDEGGGMFFGMGYGVELRTLNPDMARYFGTDEGVLVMDVDEDSALGLQAGDVILAVGDREVDDPSDVRRILRSYDDDEPVRFQVMRDGQRATVEGTTGR